MTLPRAFYARPTLTVARDLLGKVLVHRSPEGTTSGKIVEVEAYIGEEDPACHAAPGPTQRNEPLYGEPGHAYVYFNYGTHDMFNVVSEPAGCPAAILVRALEPLEGIDLMEKRRLAWRAAKRSNRSSTAMPADDLCRGPGNLARAMGITLADNRRDLCGRELYVEDRGLEVGPVGWSPRIGINVGVDRPWRGYVMGSRAVSGRTRPASAPGSRAGRRGSRRTSGSARGSA
jgi:DNA-3-methyladenine glycosylase